MHLRRCFFSAAALLGLLAATQPAHALYLTTPVPPGQGDPNPAAFNLTGPPGTVLAAVTTPYSGTSGFTGSITQAVVLDAETNHLDFIYQIHPDAFATVTPARLTVTNFPNSLDIGQTNPLYGGAYFQIAGLYAAYGFNNTTVLDAGASPPNVDRPPNSISFQRTVGGDLPAGFYSNILVVRTNATNFDLNGTLFLIDGGIASGVAFEPAAVPEPASMSLAAIGFGLVVGTAALRRRSRRRLAK